MGTGLEIPSELCRGQFTPWAARQGDPPARKIKAVVLDVAATAAEARLVKDVPVRDVTHGTDGSVSFSLDPPGRPPLHVTLPDGHFGRGFLTPEDFTKLREGDRINGTLSSDG